MQLVDSRYVIEFENGEKEYYDESKQYADVLSIAIEKGNKVKVYIEDMKYVKKGLTSEEQIELIYLLDEEAKNPILGLQNNIAKSYQNIINLENEILGILSENKRNIRMIDYVYWDTSIMICDIEEALGVTAHELVKMIMPRSISIQCPECLGIRGIIVKSRADKKYYNSMHGHHRECEVCRKNIMRKYRNNEEENGQ